MLPVPDRAIPGDPLGPLPHEFDRFPAIRGRNLKISHGEPVSEALSAFFGGSGVGRCAITAWGGLLKQHFRNRTNRSNRLSLLSEPGLPCHIGAESRLTHLCHRRPAFAVMWSADKVREAVPIASNAKRPLPDARPVRPPRGGRFVMLMTFSLQFLGRLASARPDRERGSASERD
jgi:hypothetical protein